MPKKIYDVFDPKSRTVTTIDPSTQELIIDLKTWSELTREEKQHIKKTMKDTPSSNSTGAETQKKAA